MKYFVIIIALFLFACEAKSNNAQVNDTSSKEDAFTEQPVAAADTEANDEDDYREPEELYEEGEVADESEEESLDNEEAPPAEAEGMDSDEEEEVEEEEEPSEDEE